MTLKIENKTGLGVDTKIIHQETGKELKSVTSVEVVASVEGFVKCTMYLENLSLDINVDDQQLIFELVGKTRAELENPTD